MIDDVLRCLSELLIIPFLVWLWTLYVRKRKSSAAGGAEGHAEASTSQLDSDRAPRTALRELDPRIAQLESAGDIYGLLTVLHTENDPRLRLDAADALTQMGNQEGEDYLIGLLQSQGANERDAGREILENLNDPLANAALRSRQPVQAAVQSVSATAEGVRAEHGYATEQQSPYGPAADGDPWAAYFDKQASLGGGQPGTIPAPPFVRSSRRAAEEPAPRKSWTLLAQMFGPGALGSLLVVLGFMAFKFFAGSDPNPEGRLPILVAQLIYLPLALIVGSLFGLTGYLLGQLISRGLHLGSRAHAAITMLGSLISGTAAGLVCDATYLAAP